jgi:hypothetical protein
MSTTTTTFARQRIDEKYVPNAESSENGATQMPRDQQELGNKLGTYADTITAFAFVQSVTFSFALGSERVFLMNAVKVWWLIPLIVIVANCFYAYLVHECHRGEDALLEPLASPSDAWNEKVRAWRMSVIGLGLILCLLAYAESWYGSSHRAETHATGIDQMVGIMGAEFLTTASGPGPTFRNARSFLIPG